MSLRINRAQTCDIDVVADMACRLLSELRGAPVSKESLLGFCKELLAESRYAAFLAIADSEKCVGLITTFEALALYAKGRVGIIQELYVAPERRSEGIGHELLVAAMEYGRLRGWARIEVGSPNDENWPRTLAFYQREGFESIGPRLKIPLIS